MVYGVPLLLVYDAQIRIGLSTRWFRGFCAGRGIEYEEFKKELVGVIGGYFETIRKKYSYPPGVKIDGKVVWRVEIAADGCWSSKEPMCIVSFVVDKRPTHTTSRQRVNPRWVQKRRIRADLQQILNQYLSQD